MEPLGVLHRNIAVRGNQLLTCSLTSSLSFSGCLHTVRGLTSTRVDTPAWIFRMHPHGHKHSLVFQGPFCNLLCFSYISYSSLSFQDNFWHHPSIYSLLFQVFNNAHVLMGLQLFNFFKMFILSYLSDSSQISVSLALNRDSLVSLGGVIFTWFFLILVDLHWCWCIWRSSHLF